MIPLRLCSISEVFLCPGCQAGQQGKVPTQHWNNTYSRYIVFRHLGEPPAAITGKQMPSDFIKPLHPHLLLLILAFDIFSLVHISLLFFSLFMD
jgi:hypothetical protein